MPAPRMCGGSHTRAMGSPPPRRNVPLRPICMLRLQIGLEGGFRHERRRRLYNAVGDRRNSAMAPFAVRLRNPDSLDSFGAVAVLPQPFHQFPRRALYPIRLDVFEAHAVHPGSPCWHGSFDRRSRVHPVDGPFRTESKSGKSRFGCGKAECYVRQRTDLAKAKTYKAIWGGLSHPLKDSLMSNRSGRPAPQIRSDFPRQPG